MSRENLEQGFSTKAIHAGQPADPATGATVVPIYATSTYTQAAPGEHKGYEYSRSGNPTRTALETCLAALESGERGLAFASGLAATNAVLAACLKPGDEVVAAADLYGGTFRLLERVFKPWGISAHYTDDASAEGFAKIITPKTKLVWIETPTNPLLQILDIESLAELAHKNGPAGRGQHLRFPLFATADQVGSRYRRPQHDEISRRSLRCGGGSNRHAGRSSSANQILPERCRRSARSVRFLPDSSRHEDTRCTYGPALPECSRVGGLVDETSLR